MGSSRRFLFRISSEMPVSAFTRSTGIGFSATPRCEWALLMQRIEDLKRENESRHLIHARVELYESSCLAPKREASLL